MGVGLKELRDAVFAKPAEATPRVLELTRKQHWCVPDARRLAGRALSAGGMVLELEKQLEEFAEIKGTYPYICIVERRASMRRVFDEAVAEAVTLEHEVRRPSVSEWHSRRRAAILRAHPEVAKLHGETAWSPVACVGVCLVHAAVAIHLLAPGAGGVDFRYALRVVLLAGTVGAQCAFGAQALNHELSHAKTWAVAAPCALLASSLTTFPWFSYYFAGGHERHHAHVGTPRDADADALFWLWERSPAHANDVYGDDGDDELDEAAVVTDESSDDDARRPAARAVRVEDAAAARRRRLVAVADSVAGGVAWASAVAAALPLAYAWSLLACLRDDFKANRKETCFWLFDALCSAAAMAAVGRRCASPAHGWGAFAYFALSAANSVGFLAHPCIGFWLFQHACATDLDERSSMAPAYAAPTRAPRAKKDDDAYGALDDMQPTLSYAGSDLWHWLTFQELRHLEHHDFPGIPWTRLAALAKAAPEFYAPTHVYHVPSIATLLATWLKGKREKFDFACRKRLVSRARDRAVELSVAHVAPAKH